VPDTVAADEPLLVQLELSLSVPALLPLPVPLSLGSGLLVLDSVPKLDSVLDGVVLRVAVFVALAVVLLVLVRVALDVRDLLGVGSTHVTPTVRTREIPRPKHGSPPNASFDTVRLHALRPVHARVTTVREEAAWHHDDSTQPKHPESQCPSQYQYVCCG
jgi:hypothetical protein